MVALRTCGAGRVRARCSSRGRLASVVNSRPPTPIGRGEILDQARARLAASGSVLLYGPAGIGKSTILQSLAADADPALVLRANAAEAEAELPYLALVDLFD